MNRKNIHTENQPKGSARNLSDTLDRDGEDVAQGQRQFADDSDRKPEPAGASQQTDPHTLGGQNQEKVEDRPNVGTTTPDKYPDKASGKDL